MTRYWFGLLALSLASTAYCGPITNADVGQIVRIMDIQVPHVWPNGNIANTAPIDWSAEIGFREADLPTEVFPFAIYDIDPTTFAPLTIDGVNAAIYGLDWSGLADYLENEFNSISDAGFWYEEATGVPGTSTFGPSGTMTGGELYYHATLLDRIEISLFTWKDDAMGRATFGLDVGVYAEITTGSEVPEPNTLALLVAFLFWHWRLASRRASSQSCMP